MAAEVGKALFQFGAKKLYEELAGKKYGDATESTLAIMNAVKEAADRVISEVTDVILKEKYRQYTTAIESWMRQLKEKLQSAAEGYSEAETILEQFRKDLNDGNNGVTVIMDGFNTLLVQQDENYNPGLIARVCGNLNLSLGEREKRQCDLGWYLRALDVYMATQIYWQNAGIALKAFALNKDYKTKDRYIETMRQRAFNQLSYCYQNSHPIVKSFKTHFQDESPVKRRYHIQRCNDGQYLHIEDDDTVRCLWKDTGNGSYKAEFLFTEPLAQGNSTMESYAVPGAKYWFHIRDFYEPRVSKHNPGTDWHCLQTNIKAVDKTGPGNALYFTTGNGLLSPNFRVYPILL